MKTVLTFLLLILLSGCANLSVVSSVSYSHNISPNEKVECKTEVKLK